MLLLICTVNHSAFGLLIGDTLHYVYVLHLMLHLWEMGGKVT